ncbi:MAG TPA: succinate--CoA ligase subunit alpha [Synergistaceae bacterium]|nr:succinate--CoA ligase subunit alpha [Synergistaceae bacterium]
MFITEDTKAIVQGISGRIGRVQTKWMLECGTNLVAGVTPGRGGETVEGLPVYDCVAEAVERHGANATVIFVPAPFAKDAVTEAVDAGIKLVVAIPEHVPVHDAIELRRVARAHGVVMLGPNTPGVISPGIGKLGIMPANMFKKGRIGIISRSGTLSYEVAGHINEVGYGESTLVGIGGDPVVGMELSDVLREFERDKNTDAVIVVGEIGGSAEERAAGYVKQMNKPVVAFITGRTAPEGKTMGHAGAIIRGGEGTVSSKVNALSEAGALVASKIRDIPELLKKALR